MRKQNIVFLILASLFCLNILAWIAVYEIWQSRFLEVNFFDVGQGDAIFIVSPQGHQILIDAGPDSTILEKLAKEMPFWDRSLDIILLTHPERDHLRGLIEVLKRYQVDYIFWTGVVRDTFEWREWQKLIKFQKEKGAKVFIAQAGQKIMAGKIILNILYPLENLESQILKDSNDSSIVAKLIYGQNSFLFTGDIYKSGERKLIESRADINSDLLKVAHHGSKTSSAEEFIEKVLPEIAIIQVGKGNRYGHPHQEVLETLTKYGITILRTDQSGDIKIFSDGKNLIIK
jgi:competence protein ComEC